MKILIKILKGFCIGIANVIPGFSGATMAIIVNVYDEFVSSMADVFEHPISIIKKSWSLFLGIFIGVIFALFSIVKLLEIAPLITILFFMGLIIGSIPNHIKNQINFSPFKTTYIITFLLTTLVIIGLPLFNTNSINNVNVDFLTVVVLFVMGVISASAMVIPGVSGSMILMIFGYYAYVMESIKEFAELFIKFDFTNIGTLFLVLMSFGIGVIFGVILISKLIRTLYKRWADIFNVGVLALLIASPVAILIASKNSYANMFHLSWYMWIIAVLTLIGGCTFTFYIGKLKKVSE